MTNNYDEFDFEGSYGAEASAESGKGGDFQREVERLRLDGSSSGVTQGRDTAIIRVVTEYEKKPEFSVVTPWTLPWITVKQHYAQTKQKPPYSKEGANWPAKMYAVCRKDKVFAKRYNNQCLLCDLGNKASDRTNALAIEREQVIENGQVVGIRDKTREVSVFGPDGKPVIERVEGDKNIYAKRTVPAYLHLNFGYKNFFNALSGQAGYFRTILDADYVVKRTGTEPNDTNYTFIRLNPIILGEGNEYGLAPGTVYNLGLVVEQAADGRPVTLMEKVYPEMPDLRRIVAERCSDEYFGRWFVPGWLPEGFDPSQASGGSATPPSGVQTGYQPTGAVQQPTYAQPATPQPAMAGAGPTADALSALKARVTGGQPPQQPQQ